MDNLLQVVKLSKAGRFATNQPYFTKGGVYYMYVDGSRIRISKDVFGSAATVISSHSGHGRGNYTMGIYQKFREQLGLVSGDSYVAVREALNGFEVTKATEEEIEKYGTKPHRKPVAGEVRNGNVLYFTQEQKDFLDIRSGDSFKLQLRSRICMVLSPLSEKDAKRLPTLRQVHQKPRYTCQVKYPQAFKIPEQFLRNNEIKVGDILPMYFKNGSIYLEAIPKTCSFCGQESQKTKPVTICEDCSSVLETVNDLIRETGGSAIVAARAAKAMLEKALKEGK